MTALKSDTHLQQLAQCSLNQAPEGLFWATSDGLFHHANLKFCEQSGYAENELCSLHIWDLMTDWRKSKWPRLFEQLCAQRQLYYEGELTTRLGNVVAVEISIGCLRVDGLALMSGFVRERVPRKKGAAELMAELKENVARFRILYNSAPVMLQACDFETRIFSVNNYWLHVLGYTWDEVIGRQTLEFMSESARNDVVHKVLPILRRDGTIHDFEYQLRRKSGEVIDVAVTAVSDLDEKGRIVRTLSMVLPIADRKRAERLESQNYYLREELSSAFISSEIIGTSAPMQGVLKNIEAVAGTDTTVLILGETGTGKELVARAVHRRSRRKDGVMVKVNCGALPSGLVENELFGHEKGAFTGAVSRQKGRFELAHKSTIFLDEAGELPPAAQAKLLRVLQDRELERVGGQETLRIDVRVIAATNRNLEEEVKNGRFRSDLFYRLNIFPIRIPPLRDRIDDLPQLVDYFVEKFATRLGKRITSIDPRALEKLAAWSWPGNVRELANILERATILCNDDTLQSRHIGLSSGMIPSDDVVFTLEEGERRLILQALEKCNGRLSGARGAAVLLGINRTTLWSRMQKLGIHSARQFDAR